MVCEITAMENGHAKKKSGLKSSSKSTNGAATAAAAKSDAPHIVSHLESRFVKDGESVALACRIIGGNAKFDVVWLHNNKEIKPSKDFQYTNEANIYKLQIAEIFPEDSGTYTCEAFNDAGESFSTCSIIVLVPGEEPKQPAFKRFPLSCTLPAGEPARFECEMADQTAVLQLNWLKDGQPIEESSARYAFTKETGNRYRLEILSTTASDSGQYQAKAIGKRGETFAAFSVNVFNQTE